MDGQLRSGALDRSRVTEQILRSPEGSSRAATAMYRQVLDRAPEPAGLAAGYPDLRPRRRPHRRPRVLLGQPRATGAIRIGGTVGGRPVPTELGRPADPASLASWSLVVRTRGQLAAARGILGSAGMVPAQVTGLYRSMLGRDPDPAGLTSWTSVLMRSDMATSRSASEEAPNTSTGPPSNVPLADSDLHSDISSQESRTPNRRRDGGSGFGFRWHFGRPCLAIRGQRRSLHAGE